MRFAARSECGVRDFGQTGLQRPVQTTVKRGLSSPVDVACCLRRTVHTARAFSFVSVRFVCVYCSVLCVYVRYIFGREMITR